MAIEVESEELIKTQPERELPFTLQPLRKLARNFWWSWAPDGAAVFRDLDSEIWEECEQNPRLLLGKISDLRLAQMAADPVYIGRVARLAGAFDNYMSDTRL